jgi:hypothetical protein
MNSIKILLAAFSMLCFVVSNNSYADIKNLGAKHFVITHKFTTASSPSRVFHQFAHIGRWWSSENSLSGDGKNTYLHWGDKSCFCEKIPGSEDVIIMEGDKVVGDKLMQFRGAFGPLRGQDVDATMSWKFDRDHHRTVLTMEYDVVIKSDGDISGWASTLDEILGTEVNNLKKSLL